MKEKRVNLYIDGYNFYYSIMDAADHPEKYQDIIDDTMHVGHAWCNFKKLGEQLLQNDEQLKKIVYCSAKVGDFRGYEKEKDNQLLWLSYLKEYIPGIKIKLGHHKGTTWDKKAEKRKEAQDILEKSGLKDKIFRILSRAINPKNREDMVNARSVLKTTEKKRKSIIKRIFNLTKPERTEKTTDVRVAVEMVMDGLCDKNMDIAILITEDTDLLPAVEELCKENIDVRVYIPLPKNDNPWNKLEGDYGKTYPTINNLTANLLAKSVLPYQKEDNKESCGAEKILPKSIKGDIYNQRNKFWTYDAIKANASNVHEFSVGNDIFCNVTENEKERLEEAAGWKQFEDQEISVYNYQKGTYK